MLALLIQASDSIGDSILAGDLRWGGAFGSTVDFVARSHCSVAVIKLEDMQVLSCEVKLICLAESLNRHSLNHRH
jgi:hypothetical protein